MAITRINQESHSNKSNIIMFLFVWIFGFTGACQKKPLDEALIGVWTNPDGAMMCLYDNGGFKAVALPKNIFYPFNHKFPDKITGTGSWRLEKKGGLWEIGLDFRELNGRPTSYGISLLLPWENPPSYLFVWIDEEGGARYKLFQEKRM